MFFAITILGGLSIAFLFLKFRKQSFSIFIAILCLCTFVRFGHLAMPGMIPLPFVLRQSAWMLFFVSTILFFLITPLKHLRCMPNWIAMIGIALNGLSIFANNGRMPVEHHVLEKHNVVTTSEDGRVVANLHTALPLLKDCLDLRIRFLNGWHLFVLSLGDLLLLFSLIIGLFSPYRFPPLLMPSEE